MSMNEINFQQLMAEAGEGFTPIPPGPYTVECEKAEPTNSSGGKPQIRITLRVLGGDHNGRKLFDQFTLTAGNPAALGFWFDNMAAFGLDRSFFASNPNIPYVAQMLLGRQCNVTVAIEPYQGVDRNKVKTYRPFAGGQAPMQAPQQGVPGGFPVAPQGAMPVMQSQPQFPQQPVPQGFPPQQPYAPQQPQPPVAPQPPAMPQQFPQQPGFPQVPQPQVPPVQEQQPPPWQQAAAQYPQQLPEQQYAPQPQPMPTQQPQPAPIAPGEQQAQPQQAPMWQPAPGGPPGYVDPNQQPPQQAPQPQSAPPPQYQQPPQPPQGVPPMPGRSI